MKEKQSIQKLRAACFNAEVFPAQVLQKIAEENLWNIWVPQKYGGLEMSFSEGLQKLKTLAKIDGSLGWTITLCSGANYFIGNLQEDVAREIFKNPTSLVCLGGSGGVFGTAQRTGNQYKISGKWKYATGAPYLTHFTLNAKIIENGKEVKNLNGSPRVLSFIVPANQVQIIEDWNAMGLKASSTHSFEVQQAEIHKKYSFIYDHFYLPQPIFKIHFSVFADLTLWVNYIGMAEHFLEEADHVLSSVKLKDLQIVLSAANRQINRFSAEIEQLVREEKNLSTANFPETHGAAVNSVQSISNALIQIYPLLGIKACSENHPINAIFRDYFTATQHHIFINRNK